MKLKNSPLILVLAQVKFAPVLSIGKKIEQLQESFRKSGFPLFDEEQIQEFNLSVGSDQPDIRNKKRWIFTDLHRHNSIVLTENFIAFATSKYDVFNAFTKQFREIMSLVSGIIELSATERIGLRYVDLIRAIDGKKAIELLQPSLRGFQADEIGSDGVAHTMTISQLKTELGRLVVRSVHTNDGTVLPPDLSTTKLETDVQVEKGEEVVVLDIDHFNAETTTFKVDDIMIILEGLHDITSVAFKQATSSDAINLWKK